MMQWMVPLEVTGAGLCRVFSERTRQASGHRSGTGVAASAARGTSRPVRTGERMGMIELTGSKGCWVQSWKLGRMRYGDFVLCGDGG